MSGAISNITAAISNAAAGVSNIAGAVSNVAAAIGGAATTIEGLFDTLLTASFAGLPFFIIDSRHQVGRRVQRFFFPGRDDTEFQDLGALDGPIRITGLLAGDDYIAQAAALHMAFRTAGPQTLVHPWLGEIQVLQGDSPPTISFNHTEFRIARFEATFVPDSAFVLPPPDTLSTLLGQVTSAASSVQSFLGAVLSPAATPMALVSYVNGMANQVGGMFQSATAGGLAADVLGPAAAGPIAAITSQAQDAISTIASQATGASGWASTMVANLTALPNALANASVPTLVAAVGPGPSAALQALLAAGGPTATLQSIATSLSTQASLTAQALAGAVPSVSTALTGAVPSLSAAASALSSAADPTATTNTLLGVMSQIKAKFG
jgi:hypothetical protein